MLLIVRNLKAGYLYTSNEGGIELITVELGKKIKQLRMKKGLSQEKFALR